MRQIIWISLITLFIISCENNGLVDNDTNNSKGVLSFSIDMNQAPEEVVAMEGILSRADHDTVFFDFEMRENDAIAEVEGLISGSWVLKVNALDENGHAIYSGATEVKVLSGQTTTIHLNLEPTTGNLKIVVTWGEGNLNQQILFVAQHHSAQTIYDEWRILTMNIDGTSLKEVTPGTYPIWTNSKDFFIYRYDINTLARFNLSDGSIEVIGDTPHHINFLRYVKITNQIVCDYKKGNGYWDIGIMDVNGTNFKELVVNESTKKRPVPRPNSDWIYYTGNITGINQIFKVKIDGTLNQQVTFGDMQSSFCSFDKSGSKLIYSQKADNQKFYLYILDLNTNESTRLDFSEEGEPIYPIFSEDGKYIIYVQVVGPTYFDREVFRMKTDGSKRTQLTSGSEYKDYVRPISW